MSAILFHSLGEEDVRLSGSERSMMSNICHRMFLASLAWDGYGHPGQSEIHPISKIIPKEHYSNHWLREPAEYHRTLGTVLAVDAERFHVDVDGRKANLWEVELNTAIATGSDPIILCARLHAQSEIHTWVDGKNRAWLADIMEQGCKANIFREGYDHYDPIAKQTKHVSMGWADVIALLRKTNETPCVTSYTVCDSFPNPYVAQKAGLWSPPKGDEDDFYDGWNKLSAKKQWSLCLQALRQETWMEMKPDNWRSYHFGNSDLNGWQLMEWLSRPC